MSEGPASPEKQPHQISLRDVFVATAWAGLASAALATWLSIPRPYDWLMIWPGAASSCMLAAIWSLTGRHKTAFAIGVGGALGGALLAYLKMGQFPEF